jgi:hypothetical protein
MSRGPGNFIVRANYLATVAFATCGALFGVATVMLNRFYRQSIDWVAIATILIFIVLYLLPGARALRRVVNQGTVIPPDLVHERPVVAWVVTLAGGVGHFFFIVVMSVVIDVVAGAEFPDDGGGPMALFIGLTMLPYLISLLCAEFVLVGDGVSDAARKKMGTLPIS